mgnify:CR=1 FL=1
MFQGCYSWGGKYGSELYSKDWKRDIIHRYTGFPRDKQIRNSDRIYLMHGNSDHRYFSAVTATFELCGGAYDVTN